MSHSFPDDVGLLLVSPEGQSVILMTDSGDGIPVFGINLTFDDAASGPLPDNSQLSSGTYKPSVGTAATFGCGAPASFPAPAPSAPYGTSLSVFNGSDPNGTWKLYVFDDGHLDVGSITGWSLEISTTTVPTTKAQCKKGGWRDFGYPDRGTCITFVNENRP